MGYVLKHRQTGELFSCMLVNVYDLPYYGVKVWEDQETAMEEYPSFLAECGIGELGDWEVTELEDEQVKLANVKLSNNPNRAVFLLENGKLEARTVSA